MTKCLKDYNFTRQELTDPIFWKQHRRFVHCTFKEAYLGASARDKHPKFNASHVVFENCDFEGTNFKGLKGLRPQNFIRPANISTAKKLSPTIYQYFLHAPEAFSQEYIQSYQNQGIVNARLPRRNSQTLITTFFRTAIPNQQNNEPNAEENQHESANNPTLCLFSN